ncbi:hydrogenase maturation protease [Verrucomicrobiota bacterium sgz303538]
MSQPVLIIGIGNEYRSDDAVGRLIARRLAGAVNVQIREDDGEGADLIACWATAQTVILIDAVSSGTPPGTIYRLDAASAPLPVEFFRCSTHAFSVAEAVELARALGQLPPRLILYGIEGKNFDAGRQLSPEVADAVDTVARKIQSEIEQSGTA